MNKATFAAVAALAAALVVTPARAGVVISQTETATGQFGERKTDTTITIQGNKQKVIRNGRENIVDLDAGTSYLIDSDHSSYMKLPFPPPGGAAAMAHAGAALDFKKDSTSRKILGYSCHDYSGSGSSMGGDYTVTECFSTSAPGAKEFSTFQKAMAAKLKGVIPSSNIPDGIPLAMDSTVKLNTMKMPNLTPEQQQKLAAQIAKMKSVTTHTEVTNVEAKTIPADEFLPPKGFTETQVPKMGGGMPLPAPAPSPAH
ncbi:MAG TPA: hypothetical protein VMH37_19390 [Candidatus Binataceae bacterium]|nr:hypothetical protein [Candidatus Binataceae bacterium]